MSSDIDLEAGQVAQATASRAEEVGGVETHEMDILEPHTSSVASSPPSVHIATGQDINEALSVVSQAEDDISGMIIDQADGSDDVNDRLSQPEGQSPAASKPTVDSESGPRNTTSDPESNQQPDQQPEEEPRMIGDFDGSANEFWKLYRDEAKSHDDARINTLKEGMDSALIFAGLFSAALTAFVVDSKQDLKPSPADETVYYLRQHSTILSQISVQLSSIAPQISIPPTPPPPFPAFNPSTSDIRVNVFWFMALVFSLLAALLAILVQQWVRNYMHVFQRYSDPLKSSRLRQYLYEGCEGWYMPKLAEAVPSCLHFSLFLFFAGLSDSLFNINTTVGISTIIPIGACTLLYILATVVPIVYPQSPYQNSFSGIIWYLFQKLHGRRFRDRGPDGGIKAVSAKMAQGQMQLAMEAKEERKDRDVRAVRWLIDNLTEDAEMEQFVVAIPGSFSTDWGVEVWKSVSERDRSDKRSQNEYAAVGPPMDMTVPTEQIIPRVSQPSYSGKIHRISRPIIHLVKKLTLHYSPTADASTHAAVTRSDTATAYIQGEDVVHELSKRVTRTLEICRSRQFLANDDIENKLWRRRTHACIETVASLVFCANAKLDWFGDIVKLLGDIGTSEKPQELSSAGTGQFFVMCWTCLSLVAIRSFLVRGELWHHARAVVEILSRQDDSCNDKVQTVAQRLDKNLQSAMWGLQRLYVALRETGVLIDEVEEIVRNYESEISKLEQINREADSFQGADFYVSQVQTIIFNHNLRPIISQFPGVLDDIEDQDYFHYRLTIPFGLFVELFHDPRKMQFIFPKQTLKSICSPAATLRNILEGRGDADAYKELMENLKKFTFWSSRRGNEIQRQLWRMQDLRYGGGLGFTVELFFLTLDQLLSTSSWKESHSALYIGTFQTITSDWSKYKHSLGTQNLLLYIVWSRTDEFEEHYPSYIVDKFLELLGNCFEGQSRSRIDKIVQQLESVCGLDFRIWDRVLDVIGARAQ